uniref:Uncharacterized protein n=1 Tax=Ananas comosus var. bracteatus TaxID=296719 RepID=A0A6V7Q746_ANACO|nr:unnamed protein product [Ananas comosus var. bracteatus]
MESLLSPSSLLLFCLGLLFFIGVARDWSAGSKAAAFSSSPAGPAGLPFIGSIHHFAVGLPHRTLVALARCHGPLMLLHIGQVDVAVASSREAAEDVLRTHDLNFASRATIAGSKIAEQSLFFSPYGDHWRLLRKLATIEFFTAGASGPSPPSAKSRSSA